jgi:cytochrome c5
VLQAERVQPTHQFIAKLLARRAPNQIHNLSKSAATCISQQRSGSRKGSPLKTFIKHLGACTGSLLIAFGCGQQGPSSAPDDGVNTPNTPNVGGGGATSSSSPPRVSEGSGTGGPLLNNNNQQSPSNNNSSAAGTGMPCDVATIVQTRCVLCHAETPQFNAPMSLVDAADFSAQAPISSGTVSEAALRRISPDAARPMPPAGTVNPLSDSERATLQNWLQSGATAFGGECTGTGTGAGPGDGLLPPPPPSGSSLEPYQGWDDGDVECYPLVAHAEGNKQQPYKVGTVVDGYFGFAFAPPWGEGTRYVRAFRSVINNSQVLHHWLLFNQAGAVVDGQISPQLGAHPDGELLHGWAPGGNDAYYTPQVGVELEAGRGFLLELHYNSNDANAADASGVEICVTKTKPQNIALLSWLGTDAISGTTSSGVCRPKATQPIKIISGSPHMHLKGRHMKVTVHRANGTNEVVHDEAFDFENQRNYAEDITINPGDTIETVCNYSAPSRFGKGTNDEMCYWFAQSYPAGALADGAFVGTLVHGTNSCLGQ